MIEFAEKKIYFRAFRIGSTCDKMWPIMKTAYDKDKLVLEPKDLVRPGPKYKKVRKVRFVEKIVGI